MANKAWQKVYFKQSRKWCGLRKSKLKKQEFIDFSNGLDIVSFPHRKKWSGTLLVALLSQKCLWVLPDLRNTLNSAETNVTNPVTSSHWWRIVALRYFPLWITSGPIASVFSHYLCVRRFFILPSCRRSGCAPKCRIGRLPADRFGAWPYMRNRADTYRKSPLLFF